MKRQLFGILPAFCLLFLASDALAQKNLGDVFKDAENGYSLKIPQKWKQIPVPPGEKVTLARFTGPKVDVNMGKAADAKTSYYDEPDLQVLQIVPKATGPDSGKAGSEDPEDEEEDPKKPLSPEELRKKLEEMEKKKVPHSFDEWVKKFSGFTGVRYEGDPKKNKIGKYDTTEYRFLAKGGLHDQHIYALVYHLEGRDLAIVYRLIDTPNGFVKWVDLFDQSARSFKAFAVKEAATKEDAGKPGSPEDDRKRHLADIARTPGWVLHDTKRYFLKFPESSESFVEGIKDFVEPLRTKFEEDFPPPKPLSKRGTLRICGNLYEFRNYIGGGGITTHAIWDQKTDEVVSYDATEEDPRAVYTSVARSMFRQYLFARNGELSLHPWFLEGSADYYGGARAKKGKIEIGPNDALMNKTEPESNRLAKTRALARDNKLRPLEKFLRLGSQEYRADADGNYAQGWAFVYFLRSGGKGVASWNKDWGKILPTYLQQVVETRDPNRALEESLKGVDLPTLEAAWLEFLKTL